MNFTNKKLPWYDDDMWTFIGADTSRRDPLNKVAGFITNPTQKTLLLYGPYGMGKSSVLFYSVFKQENLPCTNSPEEANDWIDSKIQGSQTILLHIPTYDGCPATHLITKIFIPTESEAEKTESKAEKAEKVEKTDKTKKDEARVKLVVEMFKIDYWSNFFSGIQHPSDFPKRLHKPLIAILNPDEAIYVNELWETDIEEMITGALERYQLPNDKIQEISQEVVKWVGYHPLLVQILCYYLRYDWQNCLQLPPRSAVRQIVKLHSESFDHYLKDLWNQRAKLIKDSIDDLGAIEPEFPLADILWKDSNGRYQLIKLLEPFLHNPINETQMDQFIVKIDGTQSTGFLLKQREKWFVVTCAHCIPENERTIGHTVQILVRGGGSKFNSISGTVSFFGAQTSINQENQENQEMWELADDIALLTISDAQIAKLRMTYSTPPNIAPQHLTTVVGSRIWARGYSNPVEARTIQIEPEQLIEREGFYELTTAEIQPGDSGSPLWTTLDSGITIIGMIRARWTSQARLEIPMAEQHRAYACSVSDIRRAISTVLRELSE